MLRTNDQHSSWGLYENKWCTQWGRSFEANHHEDPRQWILQAARESSVSTICIVRIQPGGSQHGRSCLTKKSNEELYLTWLMSCKCPVSRCLGLFVWLGSHRNIVKSSEPDANRSGWPPVASAYLQKHRFLRNTTHTTDIHICLSSQGVRWQHFETQRLACLLLVYFPNVTQKSWLNWIRYGRSTSDLLGCLCISEVVLLLA